MATLGGDVYEIQINAAWPANPLIVKCFGLFASLL